MELETTWKPLGVCTFVSIFFMAFFFNSDIIVIEYLWSPCPYFLLYSASILMLIPKASAFYTHIIIAVGFTGTFWGSSRKIYFSGLGRDLAFQATHSIKALSSWSCQSLIGHIHLHTKEIDRIIFEWNIAYFLHKMSTLSAIHGSFHIILFGQESQTFWMPTKTWMCFLLFSDIWASLLSLKLPFQLPSYCYR